MKLDVVLVVILLISVSSEAGLFSVKTIILRHEKTGLLLCRINRGPGIDPIEVHKSVPDRTCEFDVIETSEGVYSFKADNGKYLSRVTRNGTDVIEAAKSSADSSTFTTIHVYEQKLVIRGDNQVYWSASSNGRIVLILPNYSFFTVAQVQLESEDKYSVVNKTYQRSTERL